MKNRLEDIISEDTKENIKAGASAIVAFSSGLTTLTHELGHYLASYILGRNPRMMINSDGNGYTEHDFDTPANENFAITFSGPFGNIAGGSYLIYKGARDRSGIYLGVGMSMVIREIIYQVLSFLHPEEGGDYVKLGTKMGVNLPLIVLPLTAFAMLFSAYMGAGRTTEK